MPALPPHGPTPPDEHPAEETAGPPIATQVARPRRPWWVALAVFVAGVLVGVLLVGLLSIGRPDFGARDGAGAMESARPSGGVEVAAQAQVNAACLRVINEAQDVYGALAGSDEAVTDVDLQALDDIVRRLQPVEPRLARDLQDCEVVVGPGVETDGPSAGTPSAVVPTPSSSTTG